MRTEISKAEFLAAWKPAPLAVYVLVEPTPRNGATVRTIHRVGAACNPAGVDKLIREDREAMNNSFGGLFDRGGDSGRTYRVFRADWSDA